MRLVIKSGGQAAIPEWQAHFHEFAPGLEIVGWDSPEANPQETDYVLVWEPDAGRLVQFPNLKLIVSTGAGVDHILADPQRPAHVPIARMVMEETAEGMSEFVLTAALMIVKDIKRMVDNQAHKRWETLVPGAIKDFRVGVMGVGFLGAATARLLRDVGFQVAGWSRSGTDIEGVSSFTGQSELGEFLARSDILVCLLPSTEATRGILCTKTLAQLPAGASLINVGRGSHMVDADVLEALNNGQLWRAVLDVFEPEPLAADSAFWNHPGVIVTPHCASTPTRRERARYTAMLIERLERGEPLPNIYDPERGY